VWVNRSGALFLRARFLRNAAQDAHAAARSFVRTEAFTPVERLALLVDAIERTVTSTAEMEERALKNLKVDEIRPASDLLRATLHRLRAEIDAD
jgi:hypothetical protein